MHSQKNQKLKGLKMKKSIVIVSLLLTTPLMADSFNGPYLGLSAGGTMRSVDYEMTPLSAEAKQMLPPYSKDYNKFGFVGGAYGGYGKTFDTLYVGAEGSVHYDSANGWENHSVNMNNVFDINTRKPINMKLNFKTQYKKDIVFGLAARIGHLINKECLIYIKPGLELSRDKFSSKVTSVERDGIIHDLPTSSEDTSVSKWKIKISPGVGLEYLISKNVMARVEYTCSFGINNKLKDNGDNNKEEISHISHALRVGVAYKF